MYKIERLKKVAKMFSMNITKRSTESISIKCVPLFLPICSISYINPLNTIEIFSEKLGTEFFFIEWAYKRASGTFINN